jgi:hypothetical protein
LTAPTAAAIAGLAVWAIRIRTRITNRGTTSALFNVADPIVGFVVTALLWWTYLRRVDPTVVRVNDLFRTHYIDAGGGTLTASRYGSFLLLVLCLALTFVAVGYLMARSTRLFQITTFSAADSGIFYYIGMAGFLVLFGSLASISGHAYGSALAVLLMFVAIAVIVAFSERWWSRAAKAIAAHAHTAAVLLPLIFAGLCLLHYVVTKRGGPLYDEFARYIVTSNRIPFLNRHYGQSLLASVALFLVGTGPDLFTYPRALVNNWLYVSQLAMIVVLFRFLAAVHVSRVGCAFGVWILMAGSSAFSLLPHIMYDHDYPLLLDIYTDSLFGLAGCLIIVLYLLDFCQAEVPATDHASRWWWVRLFVPATIMAAFNYTAELDIVIIGAILLGLILVAPWRRLTPARIPPLRVVAILVVFGTAVLLGALQGGVLADRMASTNRKAASPFWEKGASSARISIAHPSWWYLPYIIAGFSTGFGNMPVPSVVTTDMNLTPAAQFQASINEPINGKFLKRFVAEESGSGFKYRNLIYVLELRFFQTLRAVWFPFAGIAALGWLVFSSGANPRAPGGRSGRLQMFWLIAASAFFTGLVVTFFTNAVGGNALFWKWALSRLFEPGLCLAMIALVIVLDSFTLSGRLSRWRYAVWAGMSAFLAFPTLFRILCYPTFNG